MQTSWFANRKYLSLIIEDKVDKVVNEAHEVV